MKLRTRLRVARRQWRHAQTGAQRAYEGSRVNAASAWTRIVAAFNALELSENTILVLFGVCTGAAGALGVVGFYKLIDLAYTAFYKVPGDYLSRLSFLGYRPVLTAIGLMTAWTLVHRLMGGSDGLTVPDVQLSVARRHGHVSLPAAAVRTAASAVTMGSGGSAGSEGPVAVLGSAIGSALARRFRFSPERVQVLVGAGAAAGISAAFNAPLAGAFFALEEILGSSAFSAFAPVVVSSVVAAVVSRSFFGNHPAFPIPRAYGYALSLEIVLLYPLLAVVCGIVGAGFVRFYFASADIARRMAARPLLRAALGGVVVGLLVFASHGILVGYGHLAVRVEVFGRMAWWALALLAAGKIIATSITLNFGGSGGVFTPSLYVGAATGGAFGVGMAHLLPGLHLYPEAYALVGMGALVAATTDAPLTAVLIVFEMTNDYAIVLPLMLVVAVSHVIARRIERDSLYSGWLRRKGENIQHGRDRHVLAEVAVRDAYQRVPVIPQNASVAEMLEHLGRTTVGDLPVVDEHGGVLGIITIADLARLANEPHAVWPLLVAADIAVPTPTITPAESLFDAIRKMGVRGIASLPVVDPGSQQLLGMITRANVLLAYERRVGELA